MTTKKTNKTSNKKTARNNTKTKGPKLAKTITFLGQKLTLVEPDKSGLIFTSEYGFPQQFANEDGSLIVERNFPVYYNSRESVHRAQLNKPLQYEARLADVARVGSFEAGTKKTVEKKLIKDFKDNVKAGKKFLKELEDAKNKFSFLK